MKLVKIYSYHVQIQWEINIKEEEENFKGCCCYKSKVYEILKNEFNLEIRIRFLTIQGLKIPEFYKLIVPYTLFYW